MIDKSVLYIGGGAVLLVLVLGSMSGRRSGNAAAVEAVYQAQAVRDQIAPAVIGTVSQFQLQHEQNYLQFKANEQNNIVSLFQTMQNNETQRYGETLSFTTRTINANYANSSDVRHVKATTDIAMRQLKNEALAIQGQIDIMKKAQDNDFFSSLFGGGIKAATGALGANLGGSMSSVLTNLMGSGGLNLSSLGGGVGSAGFGNASNAAGLAAITPNLSFTSH